MADVAKRAGAQRRDAGRMAGIDAARCLALIGMLAVHFGPQDGEGVGGFLLWFPHGRASILFAVVAGIGMALLTARPEKRWSARWRLVCYAAVLLPMGLVLQALDHPVAVILHHYAVFFIFGACVAGFSRGALLATALVMSVLGPAVFLAGRMSWPEVFDRDSVEILDGIGPIFAGLLAGGPYPLLTWSGPLLWGIWLGRQDLRDQRVALRLVWAGLLVAVAAIVLTAGLLELVGKPKGNDDWRFLFTAAAHSEMPLWLIQASGIASAAVGSMLLLARWVPWVASPLAALGRMTLSVYVAHILAMSLWPEVLVHEAVGPGLVTVAWFTALALVFAVAWEPLGRGPVERLMHWVWQGVRGMLPEAREGVEPEGERVR